VAGLVDEIGIVEILNQRLGIDSREKVSTGVIVKAMILNGLGFVSAPLYLFGQFFQGKATEQYSDLKQLSKKIEQYQHKYLQEFQTLCNQEFACNADAISAADNLSKTMKWHQLCDIKTVEKPHYERAGKPKQDAVPTRISHHVTGSVTPIDSEIAAQRVR
jgi:transposase